LANAELALDDLDNAAGPRHNIKQIVKASTRAADLVRQILAFSRKTEHDRTPLKLTPLVKETCKLLRSSLPSTIEMKLDLHTASDTVIGDPSQLQQVVMNLATNAAHAMRETGGSLVIDLSEATFPSREGMPEPDMEPGAYVKLSVKDTGTGITEDVRKRMFEPFFTTKDVGHGTGMGLAVVYGIVRSHGGAISVQSEAGKGSTFDVFLPSTEARAEENREQDEAVPRGNERILLVDDEPAIVDMASHMLQRLGYDVTTALDASEAFETFLNEPGRFDLVIMDQTMPGLTGIDLARRMLAVREDLPIILITGYSETVSPEMAKSAGIRQFVMKPLVKRQAAETIRAALDKGEMSDAAR
jgi:CheY-like chemotaxis protein